MVDVPRQGPCVRATSTVALSSAWGAGRQTTRTRVRTERGRGFDAALARGSKRAVSAKRTVRSPELRVDELELMDTTFIDELTLNDGLFECLEFAECGVPVSPTPNLPRCDSGVPDETPEKAPKRKKLAADGESTAKPKPKPKPAATPEAPLPDQPTIPEYFSCKRAPSTMQPLFSEPPAHTEAADGDLF